MIIGRLAAGVRPGRDAVRAAQGVWRKCLGHQKKNRSSHSKIAHAVPHALRPHTTLRTPSGAAARRCRRGMSSCPDFYDTIGLYDRPAAEHGDIADAWVATLGIGDIVSATPGSFTRLSLGQQKLVLLCRALVKRPRLLVLDERRTLVPVATRPVPQCIQAARDAADVAVLYVSHRADEIETLNCDDAALARLGASRRNSDDDAANERLVPPVLGGRSARFMMLSRGSRRRIIRSFLFAIARAFCFVVVCRHDLQAEEARGPGASHGFEAVPFPDARKVYFPLHTLESMN